VWIAIPAAIAAFHLPFSKLFSPSLSVFNLPCCRARGRAAIKDQEVARYTEMNAIKLTSAADGSEAI